MGSRAFHGCSFTRDPYGPTYPASGASSVASSASSPPARVDDRRAARSARLGRVVAAAAEVGASSPKDLRADRVDLWEDGWPDALRRRPEAGAVLDVLAVLLRPPRREAALVRVVGEREARAPAPPRPGRGGSTLARVDAPSAVLAAWDTLAVPSVSSSASAASAAAPPLAEAGAADAGELLLLLILDSPGRSEEAAASSASMPTRVLAVSGPVVAVSAASACMLDAMALAILFGRAGLLSQDEHLSSVFVRGGGNEDSREDNPCSHCLRLCSHCR